MTREPMGPFCQSCGMPMVRPEDFGTTADGWRQNEFCHFCFAGGEFLQPHATVEQMIEYVIRPMVEATGMPEAEARAVAEEMIPSLARWQKVPA